MNRLLDDVVKMLLLLIRLLAPNPHASIIKNDRKLIWADGANANSLVVESEAGSKEDTSRSSRISKVQGIATVSLPKKKKKTNVSSVENWLDDVVC